MWINNRLADVPATIGLTKIGGMVGKLAWFGQALNGDLSPWTHAFMCLGDGTVFEAQPGGARITRLDTYTGREVAFLDVPFPVPSSDQYDAPGPAETRAAIVQTAREHVDIGYNWGTYFYLAAYRLRLPLITKALRARVADDKRLICSQAVDHFYAVNGVHLFNDGRLPFDVTPGDLAREFL